MRSFIAIATLLCPLSGSGLAQKCNFGGEKAFQHTRELLLAAPTCTAAASIMGKCAWGSSADNEFADIVLKKCEDSFREKLTPVLKDRYVKRMELCDEQYAGRQGTISISEAALCRVGIARDFAIDPKKAGSPPPKTSFNCTKAITPLERAICSDAKLGHLDLFLNEAYKGIIRSSSPKNRAFLVKSEREWLRQLPRKCGLTNDSDKSEASLSCLRTEFNRRFDLLDSCSMGGTEECIDELSRNTEPSN
jgi:uncharacterized protein YecT (DUF1311 family)